MSRRWRLEARPGPHPGFYLVHRDGRDWCWWPISRGHFYRSLPKIMNYARQIITDEEADPT